MAERKAIPKAIKDKLLVDAMHRCCLCPEHHDVTDLHHVVPISEDGPDTEDNLMVICPTCHAKIHRLRTSYSPEQLRMYKERWVHNCALGLPLDARFVQTFDYRKAPEPPAIPPGLLLPPQPYLAHPYPLQPNFIGRVNQRRMLTEWLSRGHEPVFVLTAIGGMGKSALTWAWVQRDVLQVPLPGTGNETAKITDACRVPDDSRPRGVLWWSFYERESGFLTLLDKALVYTSGGAVNPAQITSAYERIEVLISLLRQHHFLLVLDGFERVLRAYARLDAAYRGDEFDRDDGGDFCACRGPHEADFLKRIASNPLRGRVLLTSRLFPRELDNLAGCRRQDLEAMVTEDTVTFFHAEEIHGTRAEIEEVCAPYGYHPLALRLLAGVVAKDKRNPGNIEVARRYPVLPELKGKEQHHILQVAYDTLSKPKRTLLSRIAAFRSPMTYETLAIFNTWQSERGFDAALDELAMRNLLFLDRQQGRYDLHPIVRQYAYDRLADKKGVHTRLQDYFSGMPAQDEGRVHSLDDLAPVVELYHHTVHAGRYDEAWDLFHGRLAELLYFRFGAYQTCIELLQGLFPDGESSPPRLARPRDRAGVLNTLANSYSLCGQSRRAAPLIEAQNVLQQSEGNYRDLAIGLGNLGDDQLKLGRLEVADANLRRRTQLCQSLRENFEEAVGHQELGRLLAYQGQFREAAEEIHLSTCYWKDTSYQQGLCLDESYRALSALLSSNANAALTAARESVTFWEKDAEEDYPVERNLVRVDWLLGWSLVALALEEQQRRDERLEDAETHLAEALNRCRQINMIDHEPDILLAWARWHRVKGNSDQARAHAVEALSVADRCEYRLCQADIHNLLARLDIEAGDRNSAVKHAQTGYKRAWCDGPPHCYKPALDEADRLLKELKAPKPKMPDA